MVSVPRNVILDLLPGYIAGEVSEESRALVEEFAQTDAEVARLIDAGKSVPTTQNVSPPDDLEIKTLQHVRRGIRRQMVYVACATACILLIPLVAMQFTGEVNWTLFDFIVMGSLLFSAGLVYVLISKLGDNTSYRLGVAVAVLAGLLLIWVNLAVGLIGPEDNPANALYSGVLAVGVIGALIARFRAGGMMRALLATAIAQALVPVTALILWRPSFDDPPGMAGLLLLNGVFVGLFVVSALLFRKASGISRRNTHG